MKILMINSVCGIGSTGRICTDICEELIEREIECCIVYGRGTYNGNIPSYKMGNRVDLMNNILSTRILDRHGFSSKKSTRKLIEFIKEYNPTTIHLHNIHGYYINIEILFNYLSNEYNGEIIWTLHDMWPITGHSAYIDNFEKIDTRKLKKDYPKAILVDNYSKNLRKKKELFSSIDNHKMKVITPSKWLSNIIKNSYLSKYKIEVINNGVDQTVFYDKGTYIEKEKKIILGVANIWDDRKGIMFFNNLLDRLPEKKYEIILVGKVKNNNEKREGIKYIDQTNSVIELSDLYNKADVFVNPTLQDNYPTTNLEALSCGTAVVTFQTGGSGECIINSKMGTVINQGDTELLTKGVIRYADRKKEDRIFIEKKSKVFSKTQMIKNYLELYS